MSTRRSAAHVAATALLWLATAYLVMVFVRAGAAKFSDTSGWAHAFAAWRFPRWFRMLVGAAELSGAALVLLPPLAPVGATVLAAVMLGAMGTHVWHGRPGQVTNEIVPLAMALVVLAIRRRRRRGGAGVGP